VVGQLAPAPQSDPAIALLRQLQGFSRCGLTASLVEEIMKVVLWILVAIGLAPCVLILWQYRTYHQLVAITQQPRYAPPGAFPHDRSFILHFGGWSLEWYPRPWAFVLLAAGIVAIVVSLVVMLHVRLN